MFYLYFLYSFKHKRLYVGQTNNLEERMKLHNGEKVFSTRKYVPWICFYKETFELRSEAMKRERFFKSLHGVNYKKKILREFLENKRTKE